MLGQCPTNPSCPRTVVFISPAKTNLLERIRIALQAHYSELGEVLEIDIFVTEELFAPLNELKPEVSNHMSQVLDRTAMVVILEGEDTPQELSSEINTSCHMMFEDVPIASLMYNPVNDLPDPGPGPHDFLYYVVAQSLPQTEGKPSARGETDPFTFLIELIIWSIKTKKQQAI
jgi:hypothetical protein